MDSLPESFKTVRGEAEAVIIEKKSRFIATAAPAVSEESAQGFVASMRRKYRDATHNVYAYVAGTRGEYQRASDDGEPSGTAGLPVLETIKREGLVNTVVNVTRYFGGTLLGASGLIRAYGRAARGGILAAGPVERVLYGRMSIEADYSLLRPLQRELAQNGCVTVETLYSHLVRINALVKLPDSARVVKRLMDITNGAAAVQLDGTEYL
ncbi:MAG: YigZ family protein [Clostridiales bacterium]|jgi:uncharacterized YigZ family protein|nr:YigZ family protein [Clostridiales bacterium]